MERCIWFTFEQVEENQNDMSLLTEAMEQCVILNKVTVPDGYGGRFDTWAESSFVFDAAIVFNVSMEARRAQAEGVRSLYTVTTDRSIVLEYHEVFKRLKDNKIFRVTSDGDDLYTPKSATLNMRQVTAEEWSIPQNGQITGNT